MSPDPRTLRVEGKSYFGLFGAAFEYALDMARRQVLFLDALRKRGNQYREHAAKIAPRVLNYPVEVIADGGTFQRPSGLDACVFTAGIGENSSLIRERIAARLSWLGVTLDPVANADGKQLISRTENPVAVYVIPTDEELMIARIR